MSKPARQDLSTGISRCPASVLSVSRPVANAAGEIGEYEPVGNHIFATQDSWSKTGDIGAEVAKVLDPGDMQKIRELVKNDKSLDDSANSDVAMGMNLDHLNGTPTAIVVSRG